MRFLGATVLCRSGVHAKFSVNMVNTGWVEGVNRPRVETQQAKAPVSNLSGIAPVSRWSFTARSRESNSTLFFFFFFLFLAYSLTYTGSLL